nr:hypothetical protein [Tanacetum cinerariifolium]
MMHPNRGKIATLDADKDVTIVDVDEIDADIQERMAESQAKPAEVEEVLEVVITAKLITEVATIAAPITTTAQVPKPSALRKRRGVVIQDPRETAATLVIVYSEDKSKDKGKGILIEEPKPLKRKA